MPHPSNSTTELASYAQAALEKVFKFGYDYQKVGVLLVGLVPADHRQVDLLTDVPDERLLRLSAVVDKINSRHGRARVRLASAGYDPGWHHKRQWMSGRYTTQWKELLNVK